MSAILIANSGTSRELTIISEFGEFFLDSTPNSQGYWSGYVMPRRYKTVSSCKRVAAMMLGKPPKWEKPTPPQENDR